MKFYIASSFSLITEIKELVSFLESKGHTISVRWWERAGLKKIFDKLTPDEFYAEPECEYAFGRDLAGIRESDALILLTTDVPKKHVGANIEVGMAFGMEKPVFSLGNLVNSAMYWGIYRCKTPEEILEQMSKFRLSINCADLRREE